MNNKTHWENIYSQKPSDQVSWYQEQPTVSLDIIRHIGLDNSARIIDVGAGTSTLPDSLLEDGFTDITVLDISSVALKQTQARLGAYAAGITWIESDILQARFPVAHYDVWHDRAVFHFLTDPQDRAKYVDIVKHTIKPGGHVIIASFASDGPTQCSGLNVMRYDSGSLHHEFGEAFNLIDSRGETHETPFGTQQKFIYCYCRKQSATSADG